MRSRGKSVVRDDPQTYSIAEVLALIHAAPAPDPYRGKAAVLVMFDGDEIKITNRLRTYLKGTDCRECGAKGAYFRKTRQSDQPRPHLNLYAINPDGYEVLMTSDHIVPKSKGGPSVLENLQPLCANCNRRKADTMPEGE